MVLQRMHDRQFGGSGVAEQMRDALVPEQGEPLSIAEKIISKDGTGGSFGP